MATFIVGAVLAVALFFAVRHVYRNFRDGKEDCCGSSGGSSCSCCSGCHSLTEKK
ncbi:Virus attachment protein p12 family protein [Selenomonas sp. GACV-9]|uniref:FeoB-associated Cys-rich membrane protein n=1 Tax=Selenomonas sp. GACV-9 TaxID=3158782 RepID=UPI0008EF0DD9|nr:Virus attachment protein p12 family protein [Selenomonas ruminantium]